MSRGKRYNNEKKLNVKKVIAVLITLIVIIMVVSAITKLLNRNSTKEDSYYTVLSENKYGVINSEGKKIIEPSYEELIVIPNKEKDVFICTYDVDYEKNTYKTKVLNSKNEEIFKEYDLVEAIGIIDENNNILYNSEILKVTKNEKVGLINFSNKEILKTEYDDIRILDNQNEKFLVEKDGKIGLVNKFGKTILNTEYKNIISTDNSDKYIIVDMDNKYGIAEESNIKINPQYEDIKEFTDENMYVVKKDNKWIVINIENEVVLSGEYDDIAEINSKKVIFIKNKKYGVMNIESETIIPSEYESIEFAFENKYIVKKAGKYGVVDSNNITVIPIDKTYIVYEDKVKLLRASTDGISEDIIKEDLNIALSGIISEFNVSDGYIRVRTEENYKYYNFDFEEKEAKDILTNNTLFLSKKDGKYGFVDKEGKVVVDYIYDDATEQNSLGFAAIQKTGKWGSIDREGKIVIEPTYSLVDNLKIDFIGKWHLGIDLNMNYYTDK